MLPSRFDLGKFGLVVNVLALAFLVMIFVMVWASHFLRAICRFLVLVVHTLTLAGILPSDSGPNAPDDELVVLSVLNGRYLGRHLLLRLGALQICWSG